MEDVCVHNTQQKRDNWVGPFQRLGTLNKDVPLANSNKKFSFLRTTKDPMLRMLTGPM